MISIKCVGDTRLGTQRLTWTITSSRTGVQAGIDFHLEAGPVRECQNRRHVSRLLPMLIRHWRKCRAESTQALRDLMIYGTVSI